MLATYKLVVIVVHAAIVIFFESKLVAEHQRQRRAEEARQARLRALGFDPPPANRSARIDW